MIMLAGRQSGNQSRDLGLAPVQSGLTPALTCILSPRRGFLSVTVSGWSVALVSFQSWVFQLNAWTTGRCASAETLGAFLPRPVPERFSSTTDEHGFSEMIFVISLPWADTPFGGRFGFLQNVFFIRVHLCPSVVRTAFNCVVPVVGEGRGEGRSSHKLKNYLRASRLEWAILTTQLVCATVTRFRPSAWFKTVSKIKSTPRAKAVSGGPGGAVWLA